MASSVSAKSIFSVVAADNTKTISTTAAVAPGSSFLQVLSRGGCGGSARLPLKLSSGRRHVLSITSVLKTVEFPAAAPASDQVRRVQKPTILVSEKLGEAGLEVLREFGEVECCYDLSAEDLCAKISLCDALIVRSGTKVTREVFAAAKGRLKVVGRAGVGIDNVDLQAATEFGCLVVNAPTANTIAAAEHGIALLAAMARNVAQADASMKAGIQISFFLNFYFV